MRFMIVVKADESTEAGVLPSKALLTRVGAPAPVLVEFFEPRKGSTA